MHWCIMSKYYWTWKSKPSWLLRRTAFVLMVEARVPTLSGASLKDGAETLNLKVCEPAWHSKTTRLGPLSFVLSFCPSPPTSPIMPVCSTGIYMEACPDICLPIIHLVPVRVWCYWWASRLDTGFCLYSHVFCM